MPITDWIYVHEKPLNKKFTARLEQSDEGRDVFLVLIGKLVHAKITKARVGWKWDLVHSKKSGKSLTRNEAFDRVVQILRGELA